MCCRFYLEPVQLPLLQVVVSVCTSSLEQILPQSRNSCDTTWWLVFYSNKMKTYPYCSHLSSMASPSSSKSLISVSICLSLTIWQHPLLVFLWLRHWWETQWNQLVRHVYIVVTQTQASLILESQNKVSTYGSTISSTENESWFSSFFFYKIVCISRSRSRQYRWKY